MSYSIISSGGIGPTNSRLPASSAMSSGVVDCRDAGTRLEVAERLVLHLIELGEQLGESSLRAAVIARTDCAHAVASGPRAS